MLIRNLLARTRALARNAVSAVRDDRGGCLPVVLGLVALLLLAAVVL